jgi:hypothetical protein
LQNERPLYPDNCLLSLTVDVTNPREKPKYLDCAPKIISTRVLEFFFVCEISVGQFYKAEVLCTMNIDLLVNITSIIGDPATQRKFVEFSILHTMRQR